ncbi:MAG TPA: winged helix-turn-helix domain-containing protein [Steroidobacteraceae bacterium]|nr:winged helix-turn-helix domain-containing protein [Steroidobacteraceae bacterium]
MTQTTPESLAFDDVVIDLAGRRLTRGGVEQALEPKAFAVLALLVGSPGRVFGRDEILDAVWGHRHVTPGVLNRVTSLLRQALGEDAQNPRLLHTVHGIGYRFDLPPKVLAGSPPLRKRWHWAGACAVIALAVTFGAFIWLRPELPTTTAAVMGGAPADEKRPSLAVLPFADLSQSHDQEYLADGLAEEILDQLAQVPAIRVVGRSSSFSFKGRNDDLRDVGRKLGVSHLLEGSVRKSGDRLRVTAQLIRTVDGSHLWSQTYARELRNVFAVQEEISRDVARALSVKLDAVTFNREQGGTTNVQAYERYLRWRSTLMLELYDFEHRRERLQLAREMVALDPRCVLCLDALASSLDSMAREVDAVQAARLRAEGVEVRKQIARGAPDSWIAKRDRSNALWLEGKRAEAIALARDIANTGPPTKERVWDYAYMIYAMGHLNDTIALVEQVRAVEPTAIFLSRDLQFDYTAARRFQDAEAEYQRGLTLQGNQDEPTFVAFFRQLAGKRAGGIEELRGLHRKLVKQVDYGTPFFRGLGEVLDDRAAMLARARGTLAETHDRHDSELVMFVADALGDAGLAVAAMRRTLEFSEGFEQRAMPQYWYVLLWNAPYSRVRAHPDFRQLLIETGVADYWRQTGRWGDGCKPITASDFACE